MRVGVHLTSSKVLPNGRTYLQTNSIPSRNASPSSGCLVWATTKAKHECQHQRQHNTITNNKHQVHGQSDLALPNSDSLAHSSTPPSSSTTTWDGTLIWTRSLRALPALVNLPPHPHNRRLLPNKTPPRPCRSHACEYLHHPTRNAPWSPRLNTYRSTRETSQECSYSRFVAWAAVRRNSYRFISSSEKLQCPLIQCRKSFRDHETMLKHLARCDHLASREYWCYDHMRIERFDDMNCKRCISHPSKRRRMLSVAKTFFNTLGNKTRKLPDLTSAVDDMAMPAPPSYHESQFVNLDLPEDPELPSTEILEIDSTEVTGPDPPVPAIDPQELLLPELDCLPMQSSMQWQPTPVIPNMSYDLSMAAPAYESLSAARPTSKNPAPDASEPQQGQAGPRSFPPSARSKNLSPSSSVRSTTSTTSNMSAISTTSSLWSAPSTAWSGMGTNFTSSSVDLLSPLDYASESLFNNVFDTCPSGPLDMISELPADMPELHELSSWDFSVQDSLFAFDNDPTSADTSYPADFTVGEDKYESEPTVQALEAEIQPAFQSDTKAMAAEAWDALSEHILSSHGKIKHIQNPLANQLGMLSPQTIAQKGLTSLRSILKGRPLTSPLNTLSLVHVIYSFSLVAYRDEATRRSDQLFAQSLLYSAWFTPEDQVQFKEVAKAIWQPSGMTDVQLDQLIKDQSSSLNQAFSNKGKGRAGDSPVDSLISTAQTFLDGMSYPSGPQLTHQACS